MATCIAKIDEKHMRDTWIVYASGTDSCYAPMFPNELSAGLFREYFAGKPSIDAYSEHTQERLASIATLLISQTYGAQPHKNRHYEDLVEALDSKFVRTRRRGISKFGELYHEFCQRLIGQPQKKVTPEMAPEDEA